MMQNSLMAVAGRGWAGLPAAALAMVLIAFSSAAEPPDTPASDPPPLSQQTFIVVQASGVDFKPNSAFDVQKPVTLKKGQMLVLKSSSGQLIEVMGPYQGKPIDRYTPLVGNATMGYDPHSLNSKRCANTDGGPHPTGGPNPDETAGSENAPTRCH